MFLIVLHGFHQISLKLFICFNLFFLVCNLLNFVRVITIPICELSVTFAAKSSFFTKLIVDGSVVEALLLLERLLELELVEL